MINSAFPPPPIPKKLDINRKIIQTHSQNNSLEGQTTQERCGSVVGQGSVLRCFSSYLNSASITVLCLRSYTALPRWAREGRPTLWATGIIPPLPTGRHFSTEKPFPAVVLGTTLEPSVSPFSNTPFCRQPGLVSANRIWSSSKGLFQSPVK